MMRSRISLYSAVLEMTLACSQRCRACGSRAGFPREGELEANEWLSLIDELDSLGCRRLTLSGGEPLLSPHWEVVARRGREHGMAVDVITSGAGVDAELAQRLMDADLNGVTLSVDGVGAVHDELRGVAGGYAASIQTIGRLDRAGLRVGVSTQVNRRTLPTLERLAIELQQAGAMGWQLQLTMPTGRARRHTDLILSPEELSGLHDVLRRLIRRRGLRPYVADNIGYLTADDAALRTPQRGSPRCWLGCFAGIRLVAVTSDGGVKPCLSLPDLFIEDNVRRRPLREIWHDPQAFAWNRDFSESDLRGDCVDCEVRRVCRGGCSALSMAHRGEPHGCSICLRRSKRSTQ
jgi:radical SAM protein with 4Fe4S-binding SPASM domain